MIRDRYAPKKRKPKTDGVQPPDRGHGTSQYWRPTAPRSTGTEPTLSFAERLRGSSLLSRSDRQLIEKLTAALKENSALLRGEQPVVEEHVFVKPPSRPRSVETIAAPAPESGSETDEAAPQTA